ncbi:MAG: efflux RND transporter periplasmic adaptor subunit [Leptospiraceae bacterium]|nr:efflux RND transporter periplasmic adaptor subunit [Leptospiraceae bacterium]
MKEKILNAIKQLVEKIKSSRVNQIIFAAVLALVAIILIVALKKKPQVSNPRLSKPEVLDNGNIVKFPEGSIGLDRIKVSKIEKGSEFITIGAPARIIASINQSVTGASQIVLFESPDINTLYADYIRSRNSMTRTVKNLNRLRDMYKNQVATEKDIIEAETDAGNAKAELAETEGKIRALGFNPAELDKVKKDTVWLISDVPESDLNNVEKGKKVKIKFTSFPELDFKGVAEAIGDNVDPTTRTVKVRIAMQNEKNQFKPGMFAHVEFGDSVGASFVIPFTSIFTVEGNSYTFVQKSPGEFEKRSLILGNSDKTKVEVIKGLNWGEEVVTSGTLLLKGLSIGY